MLKHRIGFAAQCLFAALALQNPGVAATVDAAVSRVRSEALLGTVAATTGLGVLSEANRREGARFVVGDSHSYLLNRGTRTGLSMYGVTQSRLEIGKGIGFTVDSTAGLTVLGGGGRWISPHAGVDLFRARLALRTNDSRSRYYQWAPALAVGLQLDTGACRFIPHLKAGVSVGNIAQEGLAPRLRGTVGSAAYLGCPKFDLVAEVSRMNEGMNPVDSGIVDLAFPLSSAAWRVGLRGEFLIRRAGTGVAPLHLSEGAGIDEQRVLLVIRTPLAR